MRSLIEDIDCDTTVLTVNQRLARVLRNAFDQAMGENGHTVWETPDILPLHAWYRRSWNQLSARSLFEPELSLPRLLSPLQEQWLWEKIVRTSDQGELLLQPVSTARYVREAWEMLRRWRIDLPPEGIEDNEDSLAFRQWAARFNEYCRQGGWVDGASYPLFLIDHIKSGRVPLRRRFLLAGFDDIPPQTAAVFDALQQAGTSVETWTPESAEEGVRVALPSAECELHAAALWARTRIEEHPDARITVVVPDLEAQRDSVERIFTKVFHPEAILEGATSAQAFDISLGYSLASFPLVDSAFRILELASGELAIGEIGLLLRSPFIGGAETEAPGRALLDGDLRREGRLALTLEALLRRLESNRRAAARCPALADHLARLKELASQFPGKARPGSWPRLLAAALKVMGWPGHLDSAEYQTQQAWNELLPELGSLDGLSDPISYREAVGLLRHIAAERIFQPKSEPVPVEILGMLEAAGPTSDHLWICGLHDEVWPPCPSPNPFVPLTLQRRFAIPRSSAERELTLARQLTKRLLSSSKEVVVSHPLRDGEKGLRPSPLIRHLREVGPGEIAVGDGEDYRELICQAARLESLTDTQAPPIDAKQMGGGSTLFKLQALCPFRAFAEIRLNAQALETPRPGLDPTDRGDLLHRALQRVWQTLQNHQTLCANEDQRLGRLVAESVDSALSALAGASGKGITPRIIELERRRLQRLIGEWLKIEKERVPFSVTTEQEHLISVGGVTVRTFIDRIDQLEQGGQVIIDYKTGQPEPKQWFGERPEEPQLPLYSLAASEELEGVFFAQIRTGAMKLKGVARQEGVMPDIKAFNDTALSKEFGDWSGLIAQWRKVLERLARSFREGEAAVDPKDPTTSCRYCDLTPFCRINDGAALSLEEDNE